MNKVHKARASGCTGSRLKDYRVSGVDGNVGNRSEPLQGQCG